MINVVNIYCLGQMIFDLLTGVLVQLPVLASCKYDP